MSTFEIFRDNKKKEYTESDVSEKYRKLSTRCAVLKWISLIILVIYVIVSVSLHGDELSFDSIRYVVRYMKDEPISFVSSGDSISFDYDSMNTAYLIGDDFAVVGSDGIIIYDFSGKILFTDKYVYDNPSAVKNGNELIVYNIGGTEVRFYNSYSLIHRLTLDSPVYSVSVADNGNFVLQTASEGYRSGFRVYDKNKDLIFKNNYGELTLQTSDISKNGEYIVTSTFSTSENTISSQIFLYDISKPKAVFEFQFNGEYPIAIKFLEKDNIVLLTDKSVHFFNSNLEKTYSYFYGERNPLLYKVSENNVIITYNNSLMSEDTEIEIFSNGGESSNKFIVDFSVIDLYCNSNVIHLLNSDSVKTYSAADWDLISTHNLSKTFSSMTKIDDNKFLLSRSDKVEIFIYSQNND